MYQEPSYHQLTPKLACLPTFMASILGRTTQYILQCKTTSGLPAFPGPATSIKSVGEKRYKAWNRKTPDKTEFDIVKDDKHYNIWKPTFEAQLDYQKLSRFIDI